MCKEHINRNNNRNFEGYLNSNNNINKSQYYMIYLSSAGK